MKAPALALCGLVTLGVAASTATQKDRASHVERAFANGGRVHLDLSAGDYNIQGTDAEALRIRWRTRNSRDDARVRAVAEVRGTAATIRVRGPHRDFHVEIDVPQRSDLDLNLSAGDLRIRGIEGNKKLSMWAGDVTIEAGDAGLYRRVDASVRFGDLDARPFGVSKGGIFRSFKWTGQGKYTVDATLFAGDLKIVR